MTGSVKNKQLGAQDLDSWIERLFGEEAMLDNQEASSQKSCSERFVEHVQRQHGSKPGVVEELSYSIADAAQRLQSSDFRYTMLFRMLANDMPDGLFVFCEQTIEGIHNAALAQFPRKKLKAAPEPVSKMNTMVLVNIIRDVLPTLSMDSLTVLQALLKSMSKYDPKKDELTILESQLFPTSRFTEELKSIITNEFDSTVMALQVALIELSRGQQSDHIPLNTFREALRRVDEEFSDDDLVAITTSVASQLPITYSDEEREFEEFVLEWEATVRISDLQTALKYRHFIQRRSVPPSLSLRLPYISDYQEY
eukprot:NODE_1940_length_1350_cov_22.163720_g1758_i0.p1 GENE.NODE_1940_length_1350_cov_22.163720_g1758_i0~~NODE_1940_length_1350_cov_22.163720_g1758_i0.p1  ORF type:complete len:346 (+),score=70.19 NODE_1940_length_1350_cov_22.163720_g1758_i0:111-1040(+)